MLTTLTLDENPSPSVLWESTSGCGKGWRDRRIVCLYKSYDLCLSTDPLLESCAPRPSTF